jgi:hypothetical protein
MKTYGLSSLLLGVFFGQVLVADGKPLLQQVKRANVISPFQQGSVKGSVDSHGNSVFLGIPFAATTGGENRYVLHGAVKCARLCLHPTQVESAEECEEAGEGRGPRCNAIRSDLSSGHQRHDVLSTSRGLLKPQHLGSRFGVQISTRSSASRAESTSSSQRAESARIQRASGATRSSRSSRRASKSRKGQRRSSGLRVHVWRVCVNCTHRTRGKC